MSKASADVRHSKADGDEAKEAAKSTGKESNREKGAGTVIIDGTPNAKAEGRCVVQGVRPGVDGEYTIDKVSHNLERGKGYSTTLTLKRPEGAKDSRGKGKSSGSSGNSSGGDAVPYDPLF
jgi:hypothetical protein